MTKVIVPFTFEAWLKSSGAKAMPTIVIDAVEVDIPDLSVNDLRPAATVVLTHRFRPDKLAFFRHHLLLDGDQLVGPTINPIADYKAGALTSQRYQSRTEKGNDNISKTAWPDLRHIGAIGTLMERRQLSGGVIRHNRDHWAAKALAAASQARFVDGVLYRPTTQPVYYRDNKGGVSPKLLGELIGKVKSSSIFRGDDIDILIDYVGTIPNKEQDDILERRTIHVHDFSILTWDRSAAIGIDSAREVVTKIARHLIELPRETVDQWMNLRDAVNASQDVAVEMARNLIDAAAAHNIRINGVDLPAPEVQPAHRF